MEDLFIKAATVIAVALATFSSFPGTAQQDSAEPQQAQSFSSASDTPNSGTAAANPQAVKLTPMSGELVSNLDAKSARQGDSVIVKTDQSLNISSGAEIPKGSRLVGHVTNVQARGDGRENSQIAIQFDRAQLKNGQSVPIESVIQSIAPSDSDDTMRNAAPESYGADSASPGNANGTASVPRENPTAGGMSQGTIDNNRPEIASNAVVPAGTPATTRPGRVDQITSGNSSAPGLPSSGHPAPGSVVAENGNVAIRATAIPGVFLANDIHGMPFANASGMLLGARRDVHLDSGTRFVIAIALAPEGTGGGVNR